MCNNIRLKSSSSHGIRARFSNIILNLLFFWIMFVAMLIVVNIEVQQADNICK